MKLMAIMSQNLLVFKKSFSLNFILFEQSRMENYQIYRDSVVRLKEREKYSNPEAIKEYLPILFARDISHWLEQNNLNLIIFLDTYENLKEAETDRKRHEKLVYKSRDVPVDWWIEDLVKNTKRVCWVIAGRGELKKIGKDIAISPDDTLFQLKALDDNFVDEFLSKAGIDDSEIRKGIAKLSGGHPVYLTICVDTYREIISAGKIPTVADFGNKREIVVNRLLGFMNDSTQNMVKRLCILGKWTDLVALRVLSILGENNFATYNRVKKLSFVSALTEDIFIFDRNIQELLIKHLSATEPVFIFETRTAVNKFFKNVFREVDAEENQSITDENRILFFKLWAEIILRTTGDKYLMKQYDENLATISSSLDNSIVKDVVEQFKDKIQNAESSSYSYFEHLLAYIKFAEGDDTDATVLAKIAYEKISTEPNFEKNYLSFGHYALALFHAMRLSTDTDGTFLKNFKSALDGMTADEQQLVFENYGNILKCLMNVYRNFDEVITLIDNTINFFADDDFNEFLTNLQIYKLAALNHLGKTNEFNRLAAECQPAMATAFESGKNLELYFIYNNRRAVNLQDTFDYAESLRIGDIVKREIKKSLNKKDPNFSIYADQYFRICGTMTLTCYFTLNQSHNNLVLARKFSDIAINGFILNEDKMRQYQIRAQIEAEVGNFDFACSMLDKGVNISYKNPQAEQFKNFSAWEWYHFAKFSERLLKSSYFEIAKHAVEISRAEFLSYRNKIGDTPEFPDYVTFSKMATCFDILSDTDLSIQLHETALRGVNAEIANDLTNANAEAFRLIITANQLLTLERNNVADKAESLREDLKHNFDTYFTNVELESMKVPFADWKELLDKIEQNSDDKFAVLEKMSRTILL